MAYGGSTPKPDYFPSPQIQPTDDGVEIGQLSFDERLGLIVDGELAERESRQNASRLKRAKLKQAATPEDVDYRHPRGLDRALFARLMTGRWVAEHQNILICGPTGVGKTFLACALANQVCRQGRSVLYVRLPRLLPALAIGRGDGSYTKSLIQLARTDLLVIDDWGLPEFDTFSGISLEFPLRVTCKQQGTVLPDSACSDTLFSRSYCIRWAAPLE